MLNFKCSNCQNDIQAEDQFIGDMVQCPFCSALQVVPDPMLPPRSEIDGNSIVRTLATSILWTTYEIARQPHNVAMCVPTSFFLKRISDFESFAARVQKTGTLNTPELPALLEYNTSPGNEFFIFDFQKDASKIRNFITGRPLDTNNALVIVRKIAQCLSQLWDQKSMLHQCLIPDHISMTTDLKIRIHNFGLSQYLLKDQQLLEHGFNIWDYRYLSPEFITEGIADSPACDIYSLGGILFLLCTGHDPHENITPEEVPNAPAPLLSDYLQEFPESLAVLLQMMMAPKIESRFGTWQEVIKHIDTILNNQAAASQIYYFNTLPNQTDYHEPVGLSAGDLTQTISKPAVTETASKSLKIGKSKVRPISKNNLSTMNKKWGSSKGPGPGAGAASVQSSPKKQSPVSTIIIFSVLITVALITSLIIVITGNKSKKTTRKIPNYAKTTANKDVYTSQMELLQKSGNLPPAATATEPEPAPKTVTTPRTTGKSTSSSLSAKLLAIDAFYLNNPDKTAEVLKRYEALMKEAVEKKSFSLVDRIQEKINLLPEIKEAIPAAESLPDSKTNAVISSIKKQILPLLKAEKYDQALTILLEYNGDFAEESRQKRMELAEEIKGRIAKIQTAAPQEGEKQVEDLNQAEEEKTKQDPVDVLKKVVEQVAPSIFSGRTAEAKAKLEMAISTAGQPMIKKELTSWLEQVRNLEKLKPELGKNRSANPVINAPENQQMMENAFLLQGCLYKEKEQFVQAKQAFMKIPYGLGYTFVEKMEKSLNE